MARILLTFWWGRIGQALTVYREDIREKWRLVSDGIIAKK